MAIFHGSGSGQEKNGARIFQKRVPGRTESFPATYSQEYTYGNGIEDK
jgi:hypothetical protein